MRLFQYFYYMIPQNTRISYTFHFKCIFLYSVYSKEIIFASQRNYQIIIGQDMLTVIGWQTAFTNFVRSNNFFIFQIY